MSKPPQPPIARRSVHRRELHGIVLEDEYAWLADRDDPATLAYLEAENAYTEAMTAHTAGLREQLYAEMRGRIQETDETVPVKIDDRFYYRRTERGRQYEIHCRRTGSLDAAEEILLDVNTLAEGHDYFKLGDIEPSPDHRLLAYTHDVNGSERFTLRVLDLATGELLSDTIEGLFHGLAWGNDSATLYYTLPDQSHRPDRFLRHHLGQPADRDELLHHEPDERFFASLAKTRSRRWILLRLGSHTTSEVWLVDADDPGAVPRLVAGRRQDIEYSVDHHGEHLYMVTNDQAINFRILRARLDDLSTWEELVAHRPEVRITDVDLFREHMVVTRREDGLLQLGIHDLASGRHHDIELPEPTYDLWLTGNAEQATATLRFGYSSLVTPDSIYDYDMTSRVRSLRKRLPVLGGYDPGQYTSERLRARTADGVEVPISLVRRKDRPAGGAGPLLLYGYGSYGTAIDARFSANLASLLDRGFAYAIGHVRGGGACGKPWYLDGKLDRKMNTFTDFIAVAEHLIAAGCTRHEQLAIRGGSAGGLLMGAVANLRPDLARAVVAEVPFVDVTGAMLDPSQPLTVIEFEEWGDPSDPKAFDYIRSYSPYDNVTKRDYPAMLFTAGLNDWRVSYHEPARMVARLRARKTDDEPLLLKTKMGSGHHGASGRFDRLEELAFVYAFLIDVLGRR